MLKKFKEIDIFGSGINWRALSNDNYKSNFGAIFTLILYSFFIFKSILFIEKILSFGFAHDTVTKGFFDKDHQVTNFEDFKLSFFAPKIKEFAKKYRQLLGYSQADINNYNLKDFLQLEEYAFNKRLNKELKMKEVPCQNFEKLGNLTKYDDFICFAFDEKYNIFNISKTNTYVAIDEEEGTFTKEQIRDLDFFEFRIKYTEKFYNFLKIVPESADIILLLENYDMDYSNYTLKSITRMFKFIPELLLRSHTKLEMHKTTVVQLFDLDFAAPEILRQEMFSFPLHGFNRDFIPRNLQDNGIKPYDEDTYYDVIQFNFDVFEELHNVDYLTLDDILSVVGGFMTVVITSCAFFGVRWNEKYLNKEYNRYYSSKESFYERNFYQIKKSLLVQNDIKDEDKRTDDIINSNTKNNQNYIYENVESKENFVYNIRSTENEKQIEMEHLRSPSSINIPKNKSIFFINLINYLFYFLFFLRLC